MRAPAPPLPRARRARPRGMSLVELMVGLAIGLVAVIIVMQVFQVSEGSRRTTTGGDDAQIAGYLALGTLQEDLRQAGIGIAFRRLLGCNLTLPNGAVLNNLGPVTINHADIPAGDSNTDTLLVVYGDANATPEGDLVPAQPATATYTVATPTAYTNGDRVIAATETRPSPCALTVDRLTAAPSISPPQVTVATGVSSMVNGTLFDLGQRPRVVVYRVLDGNLTACDFMVNNCRDASKASDPTFWVQIGSGVVSLRAQYGRDTTATADGAVDVFDRTTPTTDCTWVRTAGLRLAVTVQSGQREKEVVTSSTTTDPTYPTWAGSSGASGVAAPITLSARSNWQNYRYRVYETTVPIRNVAWMGASPC